MKFDATLAGNQIVCEITPDSALAAPVFCFSLMVPCMVLEGGTLRANIGGYAEVQLPDLAAHATHHIVLRHADPGFIAANRAWLPLGGYLRSGSDLLPLPALPAGVAEVEDTPFVEFDGLRIVPQVGGWTPSGGMVTVVGFRYQNTVLDEVAALASRCGLADFSDQSGVTISVDLDPTLPVDAYGLEISETAITVTASGNGGIFNAGVTLLSLRETHDGALPLGLITDAPRFGWRGQHLDCARHFYSVATIVRLLDLMALCKLNRFHWHFADDEAFRVEVDCLPDLWQKTALRGEGQVIPGVFGGGIASGGTYSKADVAKIVAHAKSLNIEVLPEIEVPAHALAFCKIYPETRDPAENGVETSVQGYQGNAANPAMPETLTKFKALATEIAGLFPFNHLHLGGDELPQDTWSGSPAARKLMEAEGLDGTDDLFGWTMAQLGRHVADLGCRPAAWEEAARGKNGGIGNGTLLFSWTGQGPGIAAARAGYDVVMTPAQHAYLDMAHTDQPQDWGANWAAYIALEDTVDWDPVPANAPDIAPRVVGIEGTFWSEFTTEDRQMEAMLAPRILGIAAKAWQAQGTITGAELRSLAGHYRGVFDRMGWARNRGA